MNLKIQDRRTSFLHRRSSSTSIEYVFRSELIQVTLLVQPEPRADIAGKVSKYSTIPRAARDSLKPTLKKKMEAEAAHFDVDPPTTTTNFIRKEDVHLSEMGH
ncbi:hypothetical protein AVEN_187541-1, partial [Araneus ventricosus]